MDNNEMKNNNVDADKILNHIKYTKHWLDKADDDYRNQRFGPGGMVIGLARAEITAAWEEAVQLKTQVVRKMPRQARKMANWKNASVVGLMASGFLIAFMVIKFAGNPDILSPRTEPILQPQAVIVTEQRAETLDAEMPALAAPAAGEAVEIQTPAQAEISAPAAPAPVAKPVVRSKTAPRTNRTARAAMPAPDAAVVVQPEPAPAIIIREPAPQPAPTAVDRLDDIDLYKTANEAIMN
jgi:hypothetical protein